MNIRYLGFEPLSDGGRRFDFSITESGKVSTRVTLNAGENRITFQESAKICYEKLRVLLETESEIPATPQILVTRDDIARFRHIPRGQVRPKIE